MKKTCTPNPVIGVLVSVLFSFSLIFRLHQWLWLPLLRTQGAKVAWSWTRERTSRYTSPNCMRHMLSWILQIAYNCQIILLKTTQCIFKIFKIFYLFQLLNQIWYWMQGIRIGGLTICYISLIFAFLNFAILDLYFMALRVYIINHEYT